MVEQWNLLYEGMGEWAGREYKVYGVGDMEGRMTEVCLRKIPQFKDSM